VPAPGVTALGASVKLTDGAGSAGFIDEVRPSRGGRRHRQRGGINADDRPLGHVEHLRIGRASAHGDTLAELPRTRQPHFQGRSITIRGPAARLYRGRRISSSELIRCRSAFFWPFFTVTLEQGV